ncbi:hypothetical protein PSECIP111854_01656 [Pseudoalteromonas sp. CIP111854]|uniref:RNA polymerase sigma factor n=1 Tax=Pseudoalteromonas holothuriae TaxID=2963714 RepID=A0A9W4QW82_9GAMM|nr:sigma-70 family RNA polymerase sigma factor [Pseudoalteromonas sp. CIP111854]CAH9055820.1 hypothetical protein PSECIP111854_01656 [Pseudoalteromonas sp. CIP111854]
MSLTYFEQISLDIEGAKKGDPKAFGRLVLQTQNVTTSAALAIVKDLDASEDVAQQVYVKVWQQLATLQNTHSFLPWLRQITRYTAINYLRDNKVSLKVSDSERDLLIDNLKCVDDDALTALNRVQTSVILQYFIDKLPEESRELVLLYYREEQSTKQVAKLLELSEANVRKKLSRIRQLLKQQWLSKYGKLTLSTAPGVGFSVAVLNAIGVSSPVAAATLSVSASASQSSLFAKGALLLGGSLIGALTGILAVYLNSRVFLENIVEPSARPKLIYYRNLLSGWIALCGVLLTLSYEFTSGWWAPVASYALFSIGLVRLVELTQLTAIQRRIKKPSNFCMNLPKQVRMQKLLNWMGPLMGAVGLLVGLHNSARLFV